MKKRFTLFTLCMTLFVMFSTSAFAKDFYSKAVVKAVGPGTVFVNNANNHTNAEYKETAEYLQKTSTSSSRTTSVNHTYYIFVKPAPGCELDGLFEDEDCEKPVTLTNGSYRVSFSTSSQSETEPVTKTYYAKFAIRNMYQVRNAGFEKWAANNEPGYGWNSFPSAVGAQASLGKNLSPNPEKVEGRNGGSAVRIYSKYAGFMGIGANANGNLTTGIVNMGSMTPTDASNHNYSDVSEPDHCLLIVGQPDAVEFYTKYKMGDGNAHTGHANFILHDEYNYRDPEVEGELEHKIGECGVNIEESEDWVRNYAEFTYGWEKSDAEATDKYLLINFTTNVTPGGSKNDELIIDDVRLIYNSELASATYDGQALTFVDGAATVETTYNAELLEVLSNGRCAIVEYDYNRPESKLTITVKGQDFAVNPENAHTYTVKFASSDVDAEATMVVKAGVGYATFCAPFAVEVPAGVTASTATIDGTTVVLAEVSNNTIPANTPVILSSENAVSETKYGKSVACTPTAGALTGVYSATPAPVGSYVLQNIEGKIGFYKVAEGKQPTVGANRAYLTSSSAAEAFFFDTETAIEAVEALTTGEAAIYDLNGVKQQSLKKGINIVKLANGKIQKVLVK